MYNSNTIVEQGTKMSYKLEDQIIYICELFVKDNAIRRRNYCLCRYSF